MKITKFGHCCLLIEEKGVRILTDPGNYTDAQNGIKNIDVVLITHEHIDHFHVDSVNKVLENNPDAKVITNSGVGKKLDEIKAKYSIVEGRSAIDVKGIKIEAFDGKHEEIFKEIGQVQNTGYFINDYLFIQEIHSIIPRHK